MCIWRYPVVLAVHYSIHYITFTILVRETWNDYRNFNKMQWVFSLPHITITLTISPQKGILIARNIDYTGVGSKTGMPDIKYLLDEALPMVQCG
jgi:hypothetical protein